MALSNLPLAEASLSMSSAFFWLVTSCSARPNNPDSITYTRIPGPRSCAFTRKKSLIPQMKMATGRGPVWAGKFSLIILVEMISAGPCQGLRRSVMLDIKITYRIFELLERTLPTSKVPIIDGFSLWEDLVMRFKGLFTLSQSLAVVAVLMGAAVAGGISICSRGSRMTHC